MRAGPGVLEAGEGSAITDERYSSQGAHIVPDAEAVFAGSGVCYLEAPHYRPGGRAAAFPVTRSFAHLLANVGWHDDRKLFALVCA